MKGFAAYISLDVLKDFPLKEGSLCKYLENSTATHEQYQILALFSSICKESNLLLDLFVNYDSDPVQGNVFQRY